MQNGSCKKKQKFPTLYQNLEFQEWKAEKSIRLKSGFSSELPKISLLEKESKDEWQEPPQTKGELSTPAMKSQIISFFPELVTATKNENLTGLKEEEKADYKCEDAMPTNINLYNNAFQYQPSMNQPQYGNPYYQSYAYPPGYAPLYFPVLYQPMPSRTPYQSNDRSNGPVLTGRLKFFEETQNYGFFILDSDNSDLFVHYDELLRAGLTKDLIRLAKVNYTRFSFKSMKYYGKYDLSQKAVDVHILQDSNGYLLNPRCNYMIPSYPQ